MTIAEWIEAARRRSIVRLDDGTTARLVYYPRHGLQAKIFQYGYHRYLLVEHVVRTIEE